MIDFKINLAEFIRFIHKLEHTLTKGEKVPKEIYP